MYEGKSRKDERRKYFASLGEEKPMFISYHAKIFI